MRAMTTPSDVVPPTPRSSRRNLLRLAGAAAAGGAAAAVAGSVSSAAADTGYTTGGAIAVGDVVRQQLNGSRETEIGFLFASVSSPMLTSNANSFGAVLGAMALDDLTESAAYFSSDTYRGYGVVSECDADGGTALRATARGTGGVAVLAMGKAAALELQSSDGALPQPPDRSTPHNAGMVSVGPDNSVWYCVANGTPGTWRELAGPGTAGAFHPITPTRVYDSRRAGSTPAGVLATTDGPRTLSIKDGRDLATGNVNATDIVPANASAIAVNVTVTSTVGTSGFLAINPGGTTTVSASTINWSATGLTLANGVILTINPSTRQVTVVPGGAGASCHFILDVTGYWR